MESRGKPNLISELLSKYEESKSEIYIAVRSVLTKLQSVIVKAIIYGIFLAIVVCTSLTLYSAFYYLYIPIATHVRPVHFHFPVVYQSMAESSSLPLGSPTASGLPLSAPDSPRKCAGRRSGSYGAADDPSKHTAMYIATPFSQRPSANVRLTEEPWLLRTGVNYDISITLDMPESVTNKDLGMFMIEMTLYGKKSAKIAARKHKETAESLGEDCDESYTDFTEPELDSDDMSVVRKISVPARQTSRRPAMLRYRSPLLQYLETFAFSFFLIPGLTEQKQTVRVFMFDMFLDNPDDKITHAKIELSKPLIQLYGAHVHVDAHFTGLRYLMYWWPVITGFVISSMIGFNISIALLALWVKIRESYAGERDHGYEAIEDLDLNDQYEQVVRRPGRRRDMESSGRGKNFTTVHDSSMRSEGDEVELSTAFGLDQNGEEDETASLSTISGGDESTVSTSSSSIRKGRDGGSSSRGTSSDSRASGSVDTASSTGGRVDDSYNLDDNDDEIYRGVVDQRLDELDIADTSAGSRRSLNDSVRRRNVQ